MFESISWSEFFTAISIIVVGYYVISTLLLFSGEIVTIFKQKKLTSAFPVSKSNQNESLEGDDFMGRARYEPESHREVLREEKTEAETLAIAPDQEEDEVIDFISPEEDNLRSATQHLIDEVRELVQVISGSSKEESVSDLVITRTAIGCDILSGGSQSCHLSFLKRPRSISGRTERNQLMVARSCLAE